MEFLALEDSKLTIASLSEQIIADPYSAVNKDKEHERSFSKIRQLHEFLRSDINDVVLMAILSMVAVFQDIIPDYRIRLPTQHELNDKRVSKDVRKERTFEANLLSAYQSFLKFLNTKIETAKSLQDDRQQRQLSATCIIGMCELLKSRYNFNFRSNLLTVVVKATNSSNQQVRASANSAVQHIFRSDKQGEVSLETVRGMCKMIKDRNEKCHPDVISSFLHLPLRIHLDEAEAVKIHAQMAAKKRKKDRKKMGSEKTDIERSLENDMKEGSSSIDKIVLARAQADTLHAVSVTYFRFLKSEQITENTEEGGVLSVVLEGLAKIAHLINIDTVTDLLQHLKALMNRGGDCHTLDLGASLNCVLTAFQTLQGPGKELMIDEKDYVVHLYRQLQRLAGDPSGRHVGTCLLCLEAAFLKRREPSKVRCAAFVKLISAVALHLRPGASVPLIAFSRALLHRYQGVQQLLDNEEDVVGDGKYTLDVADPELSNPFSTSLWELATLRFSYNPNVALHADNGATFKRLALPRESPGRLMNKICTAEEDFKHPIKKPRRHRFDKEVQRNKRAEKFITKR